MGVIPLTFTKMGGGRASLCTCSCNTWYQLIHRCAHCTA